MTISLHTLEAWVGDIQLGVIRGSITADEGWAPYIQATIETPLDYSLLATLDPRSKSRIKLYQTQSYGISEHLSVLSATFGGGTIATVTAAWTGDTLADISEAYFAPYNQSGVNYNYRKGYDLALRSRTINVENSTMTFDMATNEALLQDYALVNTIAYTPTFFNIRSITAYVLNLIGQNLQPGTTDGTVDPDSAIWLPGQSAWDYLEPLVQSLGFRLFCDEKGNWYLVQDSFTNPGTFALDATKTITSATDNISRDSNLWFDAVVVTYEWVDGSGATQLNYDIASVEGFSKVLNVTYQTAYPGPGAAARILSRTQEHGRVDDIQAVSDYRIEPSTACTIALPGFTTLAAYISAVTWNHPDDEMTIKTRTPEV